MLEVPKTRSPDNLPVLYRLTDALYHAQSLREILVASLDAITDALGSRASILLFDERGVMQFVADRGLSESYKTLLRGHSPWRPDDTSADPIFVRDIDHTDEADWVKQTIRKENIRSLAFIPLMAGGHVIGKFMTYYADRHDFSETERQLAIVVARQLAFSIQRMRAEKARRTAVENLKESEERFRRLSEDAPVMIWMSDAEGHCLYINRMLREFWGVGLDELASFDFMSTCHPEDAKVVAPQMMDAAMRRVPVLVEGRYRRHSDGTYRWLRTEARPRLSGAEFVGMTGVNVDFTESRAAETVLRENEQRLKIALRAGRMGMWHHDLNTGSQVWDARQFDLFGIDPATPVSRSYFMSRVYPPDLAKVDANLGREPDDEGILDTTFRIVLPDGRIRWLAGMSVARSDDRGEPIERVGVNYDVTEQKETERRLRLLVDELNHRVKNILTIVQSLAYQTFKGTPATEARRAFEGRLVTLANSHSYLANGEWEGVSLTALLQQAFTSQGIARTRVSLDGPAVSLRANQAFALALAFHELTTNALKYGALSTDTGKVEVNWTHNQALSIAWREIGGPPVAKPTRQGFGSKLIEQALANDLRGHVAMKYEPTGVECSIEVPPSTSPLWE